jgi:hypothetical protein
MELQWSAFEDLLVLLGLRYDDLYDEMYDFDIMEALHRLPQQVQDLRNQRLKRAMDCGFKHSYLDKEMQVWKHMVDILIM